MKDMGIIRTVDELGRILLPLELRQMMGIGAKSMLCILADPESGTISLRIPKPSCHCCGSREKLRRLRGGICLCQDCLQPYEP